MSFSKDDDDDDKFLMPDDIPTPPKSSELAVAIPVMASADTASIDDGASGHQTIIAIRRQRNPPRNGNGDIYCDHEECQDEEVVFKRKCEWDKHMDRHERPYKCEHLNCKNAQGFTYSGGLLRHQREVHKWHLTAKSLIFCPFPGCSRNSSGEGFSRKENLEEHKRRRHTDQKPPTPPKRGTSHRKRKRSTSSIPSSVITGADPNEERHTIEATPQSEPAIDTFSEMVVTDHPTVQQLQRDLHQAQLEMQKMARENQALRHRLAYYHNALQQMPAQQVYQINPAVQNSHGMLSPQTMSHQFLEPANLHQHGMQISPHSMYKK